MFTRTLGLLVAGGQSTRMGSDKAFLPYPSAPTSSADETNDSAEHTEESLWIHLLRILLQVCPDGVVVSHNSRQRERMEQDLKGFLDSESSSSPSNSTSSHKQPLIELIPDAPSYTELGPASALLTAHKTHPSTTFFVAAVDFPYITPQTLSHLLQNHKDSSPVTTYFHPVDMHPEPLLSVWAPEGLKRLRRNAIEGVLQADGGLRRRTGPCFTAKELWKEIVAFEAEGKVDTDEVDEQAKTNIPEHGQKVDKDKPKPKDELPADIIRRFGVLPKIEGELRNTNTREEWDRAVEELRAGYSHNGEAGRG
jgi:molybdopterin-guanine dinucleotide biosynthesis protein A